MTLEEFAEVIGSNIIINKYPTNNTWYCRLDGVGYKDDQNDIMLRSESGYGESPTRAMENFVVGIRGKIVVQESTSEIRRSVHNVPKDLKHTEYK